MWGSHPAIVIKQPFLIFSKGVTPPFLWASHGSGAMFGAWLFPWMPMLSVSGFSFPIYCTVLTFDSVKNFSAQTIPGRVITTLLLVLHNWLIHFYFDWVDCISGWLRTIKCPSTRSNAVLGALWNYHEYSSCFHGRIDCVLQILLKIHWRPSLASLFNTFPTGSNKRFSVKLVISHPLQFHAAGSVLFSWSLPAYFLRNRPLVIIWLKRPGGMQISGVLIWAMSTSSQLYRSSWTAPSLRLPKFKRNKLKIHNILNAIFTVSGNRCWSSLTFFWHLHSRVRKFHHIQESLTI